MKNLIDKWKDSGIKKPMMMMLIALAVLFGAVFLWKGFVGFMMKRYFDAHKNPTVTVSATTAVYSPWQSQIKAVGSTRAVLGVNVTAQLAGMVQKIYFTPGAMVNEGAILVQQNADPDIAQLHSLQANAELSRITYERDKAQYRVHAISKQQLDTDEQNLRSLRAQVAQQAAVVAKLTIRAPFSGRLGISKVNPGQFLNPGDAVVTLQRLNPIYVDFYLPQQQLAQLQVGQKVIAKSDTFPEKIFPGKITTIDPLVSVSTRNVEVEATLENSEMELTPGMFASVEVVVGKPQQFITVPQTAISFNSYGDIVYIIQDSGNKNDEGKAILTVKQAFVTTGETRGDQITVLTGLKEGQMIVTSGQLKLKNGSFVAINNKVQPANNPNPVITNDHTG